MFSPVMPRGPHHGGHTTGGGRITSVNIGIRQVWKKQGGTWRLYARQAFTRQAFTRRAFTRRAFTRRAA